MTKQHECEWMKYFATEYGDKFVVTERYIAICKHCPKRMTLRDGLSRLNEYETLKKATEALSVRHAYAIAKSFEGREKTMNIEPGENLTIKVLRAYADILEGKDG